MNKKVLCVTALHGNEPLPTLALASRGIPQCVGNPRALEQQRRFIDRDLNSAFGDSGSMYEVKRARELLEFIEQQAFVLDFHTFSCKSEPFAIVVDPSLIPTARSLGVPYVVYMKHSIKKGHALINFRSGISIEVGSHTDPRAFEQTLKVYQCAVEKKSTRLAEVFEVFDSISEPGEYTNFTEFSNGSESYFPVLAGESAYSFPGLKARRYNMSKQEHI